MIIKDSQSVAAERVEGEGTAKTLKKVLISQADGAPNFTMRLFRIESGGFTFFHSHSYEHEVYVISGSGLARGNNYEKRIEGGMAILISPGERHQFINDSPDVDKPLEFICVVPNYGE